MICEVAGVAHFGLENSTGFYTCGHSSYTNELVMIIFTSKTDSRQALMQVTVVFILTLPEVQLDL